MYGRDFLYKRLKLGFFMCINSVRMVDPYVWPVRRNLHDLQCINLFEFHGGSVRGSRHSANFWIQANEVLKGDRPENFPADFRVQPFFGCKRGLQSFWQMLILRHAAGIFVDQLDFPVPDDVIDVFFNNVSAYNAQFNDDNK